MRERTTKVGKLFDDRYRHYAAMGLRGRDIYRAIVADPEMPTKLSPEELADIRGYKGGSRTLLQQRYRGAGIPYEKIGDRIQYSLADCCDELAGGRVEPTTEQADIAAA